MVGAVMILLFFVGVFALIAILIYAAGETEHQYELYKKERENGIDHLDEFLKPKVSDQN